jgi:hypothetical protein
MSLAGIRFDAARGDGLGATPIEITHEGYRVYRGTAAFGDICLVYGPADAGGARVEFVPTDSAMAPAVAATMVGSPFTIHHPEDLLDPNRADQIKDAVDGTVIAAVPDLTSSPPRLVVDVKVWTSNAQRLIESGEVCDLSPGYNCPSSPALPGASAGGRAYQLVQGPREYNHLSAVVRARGIAPDGRRARLDAEANDQTTYPGGASGDTTMYEKILELMKARKDGLVLAEDDLAKIKEMSPEGQKAIQALLSPAAPPADAPPAAGAVDPAMKAAVAAVLAELGITAESMDAMKKRDQVPPPAAGAGAPPAKKDGEAPPADKPGAGRADGAPQFDGEAAIRKVNEAAATAAAAVTRTADANAALISTVRADGFTDVFGPTDAVATMFGVVKAELPRMAPAIEVDVKAGRLDSLRAAYPQAMDLRKRRLTDEQVGDVLRAIVDSPAEGGGNEPAPLFIMPAPAAS